MRRAALLCRACLVACSSGKDATKSDGNATDEKGAKACRLTRRCRATKGHTITPERRQAPRRLQ